MMVANQGKIALAHFAPAEPSVRLYSISKMASIRLPMPRGTRSVWALFFNERLVAYAMITSSTMVTASVGSVFTK
ncbi:MAG: hypothetical protein QM730_20265 [Anaerolineales bacterium]